MNKDGLLAAVATAAGLGDNKAESLTVDAKLIETHFPEIAKAFRDQGAQAEHDRIASIEAVALPGHDAIIAAHKADRSKSGNDAAVAVITAENKLRSEAKGSLAADEERLSGLRSTAGTPSADADNTNPHAEGAAIAEQAKAFTAEQAAKGITVTAAQAVAHVTKKG